MTSNANVPMRFVNYLRFPMTELCCGCLVGAMPQTCLGASLRAEVSELEGVRLLAFKKFSDHRGYFGELFRRSEFREFDFVQDNVSVSVKSGTIRGLHFQAPPFAQAKLVTVLRGAILDVVVDIRGGSSHFGDWTAAELSAENGRQMLVPRGFAHGFCTLEPDTLVLYKVDGLYSPQHDRGIRWNDRAVGVVWPVSDHEAILSDKDCRLPLLSEIESPFYV